MIKLAITGCLGRMGSTVTKLILKDKSFYLLYPFVKPNDRNIGKDIGETLGVGKYNSKIQGSDQMEKLFERERPDILIDFTQPDATVKFVETCSRYKVDMIIGTTGFTREQMNYIHELIKKGGISAVISPNMSLGINLLFKLVEIATKILNDYEVEIVETHHRYKKDAPSGTALKFAEIISKVKNLNTQSCLVYGRKGFVGERKKDTIGIHAIRGGDIVGEHEILFLTDGEMIKFEHRAYSRLAFAKGVLKAIKFLTKNKNKGKIYSMLDVLEI